MTCFFKIIFTNLMSILIEINQSSGKVTQHAINLRSVHGGLQVLCHDITNL